MPHPSRQDAALESLRKDRTDARRFVLLATNRESLIVHPFLVIGACYMAGISHEVVDADEWSSIEQVVSRMIAWHVVNIWD